MSEKDGKSWFARHKVLTVVIGLVVLIGLLGAAGGGSNSTNNSNSSETTVTDDGDNKNKAKEYRFAERADKQEKDIEIVVGETATLDGVKLTVKTVEYKTSLSDFETADAGKTYVVADVILENSSDRTKPYNAFNFRMQTAGGQVLDGTFGTLATPLNSGDLVTGGKAEGQVVFEVPVEEGKQYIIWKPSFSSERAITLTK